MSEELKNTTEPQLEKPTNRTINTPPAAGAAGSDNNAGSDQSQAQVQPPTPIPTPPTEEPKKLILTQEELDEAITRAVAKETAEIRGTTRKLEEQVGLGDWKEYVPPKKGNPIATIRKYREDSDSQWGLIVDWKLHKYTHRDMPVSGGMIRVIDKSIYKVQLLFPDNKKEWIEMFLESLVRIQDHEQVEVIKQVKKKMEKIEGKTRKSPKDKFGYTMSNIPRAHMPEVDLQVLMDKVICTVQLNDGRQIEINADRLNA